MRIAIGGAMSITTGGSIISNSTFSGNYAIFQGGAISMNFAVNINITVTDSAFVGNHAPSGGSIVSTLGTSIWTRCTWESNSASTLVGGGAILIIDGTHYILSSYFMRNFAPNGGAIMVTAGSAQSNDTYFIENTASTNGGALFRAVNTNTNANIIPSPQTFTACTFINNYAPQGGAIATVVGQTTVLSCTFLNNSAIQGGGMSFQGGSITISRGTMTGNTATGSGGAVFHSNGDMLMEGLIFKYNTAALYGGSYALVSDAGVKPKVILSSCAVQYGVAAAGGAFSLQGGDLQILFAILNNNQAIGGLNIEAAGGALIILADSKVYMVNAVMLGNKALSTGGGCHHSTPSSSLTMINGVFTLNEALTGGAMSFAGPLSLCCGTVMANNKAERGGALYAMACPSTPFFAGVIMAINTATRVGGGLHWASPVPLCNSPCAVNPGSRTNILSPFTLAEMDNTSMPVNSFQCMFQGNSALVGPDLSTEAHHITAVVVNAPTANTTSTPSNDTSGIPTSVSAQGGTVSIQVRVLDYYDQLMKSIDGIQESYLIGLTSTSRGVVIGGRSLESVIAGVATFTDLTFAPNQAMLYNKTTTASMLSSTQLIVDAHPSLTAGALSQELKLTDVVLPGDQVKSTYSGGNVVLALLVTVVGAWTSVIFIEEAVFCMQGKTKSHIPYTIVASCALGLCGVWGGFVMELGALTLPSVGVTMELWVDLVLGSIPLAIFVVWIAVELYVREFGRRAPRIQRTPRAEFTYNGSVNDAQSKADSNERRAAAAMSVGGGELTAPSAVDSNKSSSTATNARTPKQTTPGGTVVVPPPVAAVVRPKRYSAPAQMFCDLFLPRIIAANLILGALLALMTLLLVSSVRWQASTTMNTGLLVLGIVVGVFTSHIAFWLMFNLQVARFICPFAVAGSSFIVHHIVLSGNMYTYQPANTWTDNSWTPTTYSIIVSAITAVMCFLFTGIQFSRMQLSRNALHVILNKAKSQIVILENNLGASQRQNATFERQTNDLSRMLELIAYCGPTYTDHSLALCFAKEKPTLKVSNAATTAATTTSVVSSATLSTPTNAAAAASGMTTTGGNQQTGEGSLLPSYQPKQHNETSYLLTLDKVEEATKDPASVLAKLDNELELRDIVKNAVTLEIFKHFMMSEHAAESLGMFIHLRLHLLLDRIIVDLFVNRTVFGYSTI
jgi:predicted outer membrane repeat protein